MQKQSSLIQLVAQSRYYPSDTHQTNIRILHMPPQEPQDVPVVLDRTARFLGLDLPPRLPHVRRRVAGAEDRPVRLGRFPVVQVWSLVVITDGLAHRTVLFCAAAAAVAWWSRWSCFFGRRASGGPDGTVGWCGGEVGV